MVNQAASRTVVMSCKVSAVTGNTFAAASNSRSFEGAIGCGVVAGCASGSLMNLTNPDKRRGGCGMTMLTVVGRWCDQGVNLDLSSMVVVMGVKVSGMTLGTGAAGTAVDSCITIAVGAGYACACCIRVTEVAGVVVGVDDLVSTVMAVDTKGGGCDCSSVIVAMQGGEEGRTMTNKTLRVRCNCNNQRPV